MNQQTQQLVLILAAIDAVHVPLRSFDRAARVAYQMRDEYLSAGIPWPDKGGDEATRQASHTLRVEMESDGLIVRIVRKTDRALHVRLTDRGEDMARYATGLPPIATSVGGLERLVELDDKAVEIRGRRWISERTLAGVEPREKITDAASLATLVKLEQIYLPSSIRGWCGSGSSGDGQVYYCITDIGREAIEQHAEDYPRIKKPDPAAFNLYQSEIARQIAALASAPLADTKEIGPMPLPVSMGAIVN